MEGKPLMYADMSERDLLTWQLDYTMPMIIKDFEAIPDDKLGWRPAAKARSAGQIFGHIMATERVHVRGFVQGIDDFEKDAQLFHRLSRCAPSANKVVKAMASKEQLIAAWRAVRKQTHEYLSKCSVS